LIPFIKKHITTSAKFFSVLSCALVISYSASAQFAPSPCDPDYYESLEARAWLEAQREITQNQNLIFKPDSVLEYTCFDNHLKELAQHAEDMFSENDRWGTILSNTHMDDALTSLVSAALGAYDTANFGHALLGGRVTATGGFGSITHDDTDGDLYTLESSTTGGDYTCDVMQAVWQKAKCMSFNAVAAEDGFFNFDDYAADPDKRFLPERCNGGAPLPEWAPNIETALPPISATVPWDFDDVDTYLDHIFPTSGCGSTPEDNVATGLVVHDPKHASGDPEYYVEHVCIVSGCYWDPDTSSGSGADGGSNVARGGACTQ